MAERSTAAVDVADNGGTRPPTADADRATADGADKSGGLDETANTEPDAPAEGAAGTPEPADRAPAAAPAKRTGPTGSGPDPHSGHKLARRYRLEECVTRLDGFSSWRAVDEKLRRAVGVHLLPADHPRARSVLAAARSAALLTDPRFVQVLDAVEENELVYVVHEWLPDATELGAVLAAGPMEPYEAHQLVLQVSQAMAAAHREGLSHLRLTPSAILRTSTGQFRIRGLAVNAALRGITDPAPHRTDTEAIGALLYASLTQRWPYEEDAYGLTGLPKGVGLIAPDQVRAGVHRGLGELAMRALANDGATASRQEPPCVTPEELAKAAAGLPRIAPPEPAFSPTPDFRGGYQQGAHGRPGGIGGPTVAVPVPPPPPLQSTSGKVLKWGVVALLVVAVGLGSWQLATVLIRNDPSDGNTPSTSTSDKATTKPTPVALPIKDAAEYLPGGLSAQNPDGVRNTYDKDSNSYWRSKSYVDGPKMGIYRPGVGLVYDLGSEQEVTGASIALRFGGDHTTGTLYAATSMSPSGPVTALPEIASATTQASPLTLNAKKPVKTRYVVLWITAMPYAGNTEFSDPGYKQYITDVKFTGFTG
ncbi:protein kinase family protein [Streptomyces sp. BI20]|uniref:protein kinase family protein n=1 Tax=Streptomyces sp. BI20 TaxID=3403460 RepID=UPI003C71D77B